MGQVVNGGNLESGTAESGHDFDYLRTAWKRLSKQGEPVNGINHTMVFLRLAENELIG
jgi:DNA-binding transcriptional regulator PaaX